MNNPLDEDQRPFHHVSIMANELSQPSPSLFPFVSTVLLRRQKHRPLSLSKQYRPFYLPAASLPSRKTGLHLQGLQTFVHSSLQSPPFYFLYSVYLLSAYLLS